MSAKKRRQTIDKLQREQAVRRRREDKLQRKAEARALKAGMGPDGTPPAATDETPGEVPPTPEAQPSATVDTTKNGSGMRDAPSLHVHQ